mmetsp:Transcript_12536/g.20096  ORF Transcript_12536/g.20096 Transcript_12536/m.20096 type:complete len:206 (-) Transcript_12536:1027-1644(-)
MNGSSRLEDGWRFGNGCADCFSSTAFLPLSCSATQFSNGLNDAIASPSPPTTTASTTGRASTTTGLLVFVEGVVVGITVAVAVGAASCPPPNTLFRRSKVFPLTGAGASSFCSLLLVLMAMALAPPGGLAADALPSRNRSASPRRSCWPLSLFCSSLRGTRSPPLLSFTSCFFSIFFSGSFLALGCCCCSRDGGGAISLPAITFL